MRTRYVNRTISNIIATCNIYNTETKEIDEKKIALPAGVKESKLDKEVSKTLLTNEKLLEIVTTETVEAHYRMTEDDFIKSATIVPEKAFVDETED